jgi:SAM-dependent methyltransferase
MSDVREQVREHYALAVTQAVSCCGPTNSAGDGCCGASGEGAVFYDATALVDLPDQAVAASMGCGNPTAIAELVPGERVLDLGSGGGIDVLLAAKQVGPTGHVYGVDMTDEMLAVARVNAERAGLANVEFRKGVIEDLPLEDACVDVVMSNCVVNLSPDKPAVLAEAFRVLVPGGRVRISDVVAEDRLTPDERAERGSFSGCIAGALSRSEYLEMLAGAGFIQTDVALGAEVAFTGEPADGMHSALVTARKPLDRSL